MAVQLTDVTSLSDPLLANNFEFEIPNPPGGGDGRQLKIQNMSVGFPTRGVTQVELKLHRHKVKFAGSANFKNEFTSAHVDTASRTSIDLIEGWLEAINSSSSGIPHASSAYKSSGYMRLIGSDENIVMEREYTGLWPVDVNEVELNGDDDTKIIVWVVRWSFDAYTKTI